MLHPWELEEGGYIKIIFTYPLIGTITNNERNFSVIWNEYDMVPEGTMFTKDVHPSSVYIGNNEFELILGMSAEDRFRNVVGDITIYYDGGGSLRGTNGPVERFRASFNPHDLICKPNQNDAEHAEIINVIADGMLFAIGYIDNYAKGEHLEIEDVNMDGTLIKIFYSEGYSRPEHLDIVGISVTGVLINIGDL